MVSFFFFLLYLYFIVLIIFTDAERGGGIYNQILAGAIIVFCTIRVILSKNEVNKKCKNLYRVSIILMLYLVLRWGAMFLSNSTLALFSLRSEVTILFWITGFIFCIREFNNTNLEIIKKKTSFLIILSFVVFFHAIYVEMSYLQSIDKIGANNTSGSAYMLVPLILIIFEGRKKIIYFILCLIVCAWSNKRQALLGFSIISFFILIDLLKTYFKSFKFLGVIFIILAMAFSSVIISSVFSGIIERQEYLTDKGDDDSGRNQIWDYALSGYSDASLTYQVFGGGPGTGGRYVAMNSGIFVAPHNGFIQVLCDFGLIGLIIYIVFFFYLFKFSLSYLRESTTRKILLGLSFAWFNSNIFSHAGRIWTILLCIAIGIVLHSEFEKKSL